MKMLRLLPLTAIMLTLAGPLTGCGERGETEKDKEIAELRQLAEMDRKEMENQYAEFAAQYGEMKKEIRDDSLVARLDAEQRRAEALLKELQDLKTNSAAEIMRLKRELETVRAVLRDYIRQVDSLQTLNETLTRERDEARSDAERTRRENTTITERNDQLSEQVAVAAQLHATGISISALKKTGKPAKRSKDITRFAVTFTVTRNVTAKTGNRTFYIRMLKPGQDVLHKSGTFAYENKQIDYSAQITREYTGEELKVTVYVPVDEFLSAGEYTAYIFADGQMIGSGSATVSK